MKKNAPKKPKATQPDWQEAATAVRPRGRPVGVTAKVRHGIARATSLIASGMLWDEVAESLGVTLVQLKDWQFRHPGLWNQYYAAAMQSIVDAVRQTAGTDAVLDNVPAFMAAAKRAEKWTAKQGQTLFGYGDAMTLTRFFHEVYTPLRLADAAQTTLVHWGVVLKNWTLLTGDPPLSEITPLMLARYRDCLQQLRGRSRLTKPSPTTVATKLAMIGTLLAKAGPPGRGNRDAVGILDKVPWVRPPKKRLRPVRVVTDDELNAVYNATPAMDAPFVDGIKPAAWWKALLVTTYCTGLRRGTLFRLEMRDVRWEEARILVPPEKMKTRTGLNVHLPAVALKHLLAFRTARKLLFPWPYDKKTLTWFGRLFHRLQDIAGIEKHFGLHDLRKTLATLLWERDPAAAQLALGHTTPDTTRTHYVQSSGIVARAIDGIPIPAAFTGPQRPEDDAA